ncbi:MAG: adenosylcobinamide kinase/adenosylcobinamide phosphate guanyltransferase [Bacteroidetes bacterium]|nr:MAG: adenosylcobinamide kinase/adenosylcobinamide phosphate guanyltransferase [Bacteroidota bacterium]
MANARGEQDQKIEKKMLFVTGGARSGKSNYAQQLALQHADNPVYVATARRIALDEEFEQRIKRHQADRNGNWTSIEEPLHVSKLSLEGRVVVIDCITLWLTNFFSLHKYDVEASLAAIKAELNELKQLDSFLIIISNEIGLGVHADTEIGRKFTDLQGWTNQYVAAMSDEVVFMISGIPMIIKKR